jgi:hypothetical protein
LREAFTDDRASHHAPLPKRIPMMRVVVCWRTTFMREIVAQHGDQATDTQVKKR